MYSREEPEKYQPREQSEYNRSSDHHQSQPEEYKPGPIPIPKHHRDIDWLLNPPAPEPQPNFQAQKLAQTAQDIGLEYIPLSTDIDQLALHLNQIAQVSPQAQIWWLSILGNLPLWGGLLDTESGRLILKTAEQEYALVEGNTEDLHRCLQAIPTITGEETPYQEYPLLRGLDRNLVEVAEDVMSGARKEDIQDFIAAAISGEASVDYHKEEVIPLLNWAAIQAGEQPQDWVTADREKAVFSAVISDRTIFVHPYDVNVADDLVTAIELLYQRRASTPKKGQAIVDAMTKIINNDNRWGTDSNDLRRMLNEIIKLEAETRESWSPQTSKSLESINNLNQQQNLTNTQNTQNSAQSKSLTKTEKSLSGTNGKDSLIGASKKDNLIANQTNLQTGERELGIVINSPTTIAVPETKTEYAVNLGQRLEPREWFTYRWTVINDPEAIKREREKRGFFGDLALSESIELGTTREGKKTIEWDFPGIHTVRVEVYVQGELRDTHSYIQEVQDPQNQALQAFETQNPPLMQSDVYLTWLSVQLESAKAQGAEEKQLQQIQAAKDNAQELLGVSAENPTGTAIPLSANLVPTAEPIAAPLQLYLKPIAGGWAIVDLTDPSPGAARTYEGKVRTTGRQADKVEPEERTQLAIDRAWSNFVQSNPHPAGELVAQFPQELMGSENQLKQAHSDGESTLQKVRNWFSGIGLVAGLGGLALTVATGGVGTVAVGLFTVASAAGVVSGGANLADRLQHGNFQWDGETALDLVDIAGGLAGGTTAILSLGSKATNITKVRNAMLLAEGIETGSDITGGIILGGQYLSAIEEIKQDPNLSAEQKKAQISQILASAVATGGLMVLGTVGGGQKPKGNGTNIDVDVDTPKIPKAANNPATSTTNNQRVEAETTAKPAQTNESITPDLPNFTSDSSNLVKALPEDLRGQVAIEIDESLTGSTVRVYYQPDVHIKVGRNATALDIQLHIGTVRTLRRYSGLTGKVRALLERIYNWIKRNGEPPVGSRAWEAKLELEKLPNIIAERQARLAAGDLDPGVRADLEAEIADLEQQIDYHARTLDEMDVNPGVGYVAAELKSDSANAAAIISKHANNLQTILGTISDPKRVARLSQEIKTIEVENTKLIAAKNNGTVSTPEIKAKTESLIQKLDEINAEIIKASKSSLNQTNTGLGSDALGEYKQWQQDLIDLEEMIASDPQLKEQYTTELRKQQLEWASVPDDEPELWYSMIREILRPELASTFKKAADDLIERKKQRLAQINQTLDDVDKQVKKRSGNLIRKRGLSYGDAITEAELKISSQYPELAQLRSDKTQLESDIKGIEAKKRRIEGQKATERFAKDVTPQGAWERLKQNHDRGGESSSSKFASVLIEQGVIKSEKEIVTFFKTIPLPGKTLDNVRQQFKNQYRPELLKIINSQSTPELKYQKMRDIAENLDVREQGEISEYWYQIEVAKTRGVPNSTQVTLDKTQATEEYGIELTSKKNRRFDEVYGDENNATIREHKHIKGKLQGEQLDQYDDNIAIVHHNYEIDNKTIQGDPITNSKKDTSVVLEKNGKKYKPNELVYTFATPEGVLKNADFMIRELEKHSEYLSFQIVNNTGKIKTIDIDNINDLYEPALSRWLGFDQ